MVTNPAAIEPEPTKGEKAKAKAEAGFRLLIAGHERGAVRRIVLYLVTFMTLYLAAVGVAAAAVLGLVALVLLVTTDDYR